MPSGPAGNGTASHVRKIRIRAAVAGVTTAVLVLIFKTWLGVPLPVGLVGL